MPQMEIKKYPCPKCGKDYEDTTRGNFPGKPCPDCSKLMRQVNQLERQLLRQDFSVEQEDEKVVSQMFALLSQEGASEELITSLAQKLLTDQKRRKKILKEILKLQKKKR